MIRILIVDDQKSIREGLKALLEPEPDLAVVGTAEDGETAIEQVEALLPDVVLIDMEMPGLDGVSATKIICERFPDTKVLVLSGFDRDEYISQSLCAGAKGYLLKSTPAPELREAIRSVQRGYAQIGPGLFEKILPGVVESRATKTHPSTPIDRSTPIKLAKANSNGKTGGLVKPMGSADSSALAKVNQSQSIASAKFDQSVVLRQSPVWSRAILWVILGVAAFGLGWAYFAKIEQVVPARGQLKPQGAVKEVQAPINGVVEEVHVKDGQRVEQGELLVKLDSTAAVAELGSQKKIRQSLSKENQFYRTVMNKSLTTSELDREIVRLEIPTDVALLARNRTGLVAENQLFSAQLGITNSNTLDAGQLARLSAAKVEANSRTAAARLEKEQLEKQLNQNRVQLADAKNQLAEDRKILEEIKVRNREAKVEAQNSLEIEQSILADIDPLVKEGAVARLQLERQRQQLNDRRASLIQQKADGDIEYKRQQQQVQGRLAEIERLEEERQRLRLDIDQAKEQLLNTISGNDVNVLDRIASNQQQIAQIDSQLTKIIVENDKQIAQIDSQISRSQQTLRFQELRAPVSGTIFDLKAGPGFVQSSPNEPILKIVPDDKLIAEVYIDNKDIGFVRQNMEVDVIVSSFPVNEFGEIKGEVTWVGSDALEPDQLYQFYRFPAKVLLEKQGFVAPNGQPLPLQSGMSVTANIRVQEKRRVISLLFDKFSTQVEPLKQVR